RPLTASNPAAAVPATAGDCPQPWLEEPRPRCDKSVTFHPHVERGTRSALASPPVARLPRYVLPPQGVYHATSRGVARSVIARDDEDRLSFLTLLAREVRREAWSVHAFCLMPNHYHVVVETQLDRLSRGLHRLNGELALSFNQRHGRWGHL